jgi:hypothetical protein
MNVRSRMAIVLAGGLGACGGGRAGAPTAPDAGDAGDGGEGGTYAAPHAPLPHVVSAGGPVVASPKLVEITFQGDSLQGQIDTFMQQLGGATAYWQGATAEYGVGPLVAITGVTLAEAAPTKLTDAQVQAWLRNHISAGQVPAADADTIYVIFYPAQSIVTMGDGSLCGMSSADDFQGYHDDFALTPNNFVSYAVVGRCPPPIASVAEIDEVTAEASHEIIEAMTDPLPTDNPAYIEVDNDHLAWQLIAGPEIADMCAANGNAFFTPAGVSNLVQRVWSNAAAAASHDPCEPYGSSPYFNAAPVLEDTVQIPNTVFGPLVTKGVTIPVGTSKTIEVDLFSDAPTPGPWTVTPVDLSSAFFGSAQPALTFKLDKTTGQNGDKLQLTITSVAKGALGAAPFWLQSDLGGVSNTWVGVVGN